jgi:hypothetical protein
MTLVIGAFYYEGGALAASLFDLSDWRAVWWYFWKTTFRAKLTESALEFLREAPAIEPRNSTRPVLDHPLAFFARTSPSGASWVLVTKPNYPPRVAFSLADHLLRVDPLSPTSRTQCVELVRRYQKPEDADIVESIAADLDAIRENMITSVELLLERGDSLETLLDASNSLRDASKTFTRKASATTWRCWSCAWCSCSSWRRPPESTR